MAELISIFFAVKRIIQAITMIIAIVVGFRIYRKWNGGEDIEESIYYWFFGLISTTIAVELVARLFKL
ncbi:hypothetical protein Emtol_0321 (plasmid) [Emticicia oligotrophica DSM 17448]|uniref:DUF4134 domain-containing protein n=1 Tax=Emticicia oligotrophica (strain DSM 17448 / CIP 109782 / MTCC 6937 / GPTSA100-15) TaxID=929562 RepID=A0ABN4ASJ7_EMTOG|nr:DUF4134 family protein [Emticicia oligotrophica]AFK05588.1 hypothetical protein Emtol_0321 [Emticicia oligotrophica DSM 17448]